MTSPPPPSAAVRLAYWIRANDPYAAQHAMTHMRLQKLAFYAVGAALAHGTERLLSGEIHFEPWQHGPVNRDIWYEHRRHGAGAIPAPPAEDVPSYHARLRGTLEAALAVYGRLDAWGLRQQSHLEAPWRQAWQARSARLDQDSLRAFFRDKFAAGRVEAPELLSDGGSFRLDRIPVPRYASLAELGRALTSTAPDSPLARL